MMLPYEKKKNPVSSESLDGAAFAALLINRTEIRLLRLEVLRGLCILYEPVPSCASTCQLNEGEKRRAVPDDEWQLVGMGMNPYAADGGMNCKCQTPEKQEVCAEDRFS